MTLEQFAVVALARHQAARKATPHQIKAAKYMNMWRSGWHLGWKPLLPWKTTKPKGANHE